MPKIIISQINYFIYFLKKVIISSFPFLILSLIHRESGSNNYFMKNKIAFFKNLFHQQNQAFARNEKTINTHMLAII